MDDELELNRFRKTGHGVVLEEHSHCEVPAGFGGVVLRWVRPDSPCAVEVRLFAPRTTGLWVDGVVPERMRVTLAPGPHVLALEVPWEGDPLVMAILALRHRKVAQPSLATGDGSWRCSWRGPADWRGLAFDDGGWAPMVESTASPPEDPTSHWRYEYFGRDGARPVAPTTPRPTGTTTLLVRRRFTVSSEGLT